MGKFQPGNPGGPGRPPKVVEDAKQSVLFRLFNEKEEEAVVRAQIRQAKKGDTTAATWLWDRKYGKVKDIVDQELIVRVVRERRGNPGDSAAGSVSSAGADTD